MRDFKKLAESFAQVYNLENAQEVFDGGYEEQVRNPAFVGMLLFNCMLMNALYGCRRGGCAGCRARALFDGVTDAELKAKVSLTMDTMDAVDGAGAKPEGAAQ